MPDAVTPPGLVDCLIVGGGPAGLTAAVYLARFHLSLALVDAGGSRAGLIPRTRNQPMFPDGIAGRDLLRRMRTQASFYQIEPVAGTVDGLVVAPHGFTASAGDARHHARTVLLATGIADRRPPMPKALHDAAVASGQLRYCPICDGFEVTDREVAVFGTGHHGSREAAFLRSYTRRVTLVAADGAHTLSQPERDRLQDMGVVLQDGPARDFSIADGRLGFTVAAGRVSFETAYPALGATIHSALARAVGAECTEAGCIVVDAHQRSSVAGLYAAGDVVPGLDQLSAAFGQASIAATAIRNDLDNRSTLLR